MSLRLVGERWNHSTLQNAQEITNITVSIWREQHNFHGHQTIASQVPSWNPQN